jgi:hypothetical protein
MTVAEMHFAACPTGLKRTTAGGQQARRSPCHGARWPRRVDADCCCPRSAFLGNRVSAADGGRMGVLLACRHDQPLVVRPVHAGGPGDVRQERDRSPGRFSAPLERPHLFGLIAMYGGSSEWCWGRYSPAYYQDCADRGIVVDPRGPDSGEARIRRGGTGASRAGGGPDAESFGRPRSVRSEKVPGDYRLWSTRPARADERPGELGRTRIESLSDTCGLV